MQQIIIIVIVTNKMWHCGIAEYDLLMLKLRGGYTLVYRKYTLLNAVVVLREIANDL